jgi:hypothetical protein
MPIERYGFAVIIPRGDRFGVWYLNYSPQLAKAGECATLEGARELARRYSEGPPEIDLFTIPSEVSA